MKIVLNGEPKDIPDRPTIAQLIEHLGLAKAACAVEVNKRLIPKRDHPVATIAEGDAVEVVTLVGGG